MRAATKDLLTIQAARKSLQSEPSSRDVAQKTSYPRHVLADSEWGAGVKTVRTVALSLLYSTAEYYASVWRRRGHTHLIDSALNGA